MEALDYGVLTASGVGMLFFLVFLASFMDAIAGGGGLISLPAFLLSGIPVHFAMGSNKVSASCGTLMASIQYFRGGALDGKVAVVSALCALLGSTGGTTVALHLPGDLLKGVVTVIIPVAAIVILARRNLPDVNRSGDLPLTKRMTLAGLVGLLIGFYDGMIGPGTGTFAIIAYCLLMGYDMRTASGNAKLLNLASNVASAVTFGLAGSIAWRVALPAAVFCVLGGFLGSRMALRWGSRFIRPVLLLVLVLMMGKLAADVWL